MTRQPGRSNAIAIAASTLCEARHAMRALVRNPGISLTAIAVLSLAFGANIAMFSVLNAVLLRPLPYAEPDRLVMLWSEIPSQGVREGRLGYREVELLRGQADAFDGIAVFDPVSVTLTGDGEAERISVARASPNLFALVGMQPLQGRSFSTEEAEERQRVAVISHRFWQSRFGGLPGAIGSTLELDGVPSRIVGILPAEFGLDGADVWEPMTLFPDWQARSAEGGDRSWLVVARLRAGATLEQARTQLATLAERLGSPPLADGGRRSIGAIALSRQVNGPGARMALWMLSAAVVLVLLIAAVNVAGLVLARSVAYERELAVRIALGATRARIGVQLLAESVILAGISGLVGLLLAVGATAAIQSLEPGNLARLDEAGFELRELGWASWLSLLTGALIGGMPALQLSRRTRWPSALIGGRRVAGTRSTATRRALVVTQFALAVILLAGSGLLVRSLWFAQNVELGFRPDGVLSIQLAAPPDRTDDERVALFRSALAEVESLPGVDGAGLIGDLLIGGAPERPVATEGGARGGVEVLRLRSDEVSPSLFRVLETPLLEGRPFSAADGAGSDRVAIVNAEMARRLWPERSALNQRFKFGPADAPGPWFTVVGVVADMRRQGLENDAITQMFEPLAQNPSRLETVLVRTSLDDPMTLVGAVRAAVGRVAPGAALYDPATLDSRMSTVLAPRRFQVVVLLGFAAIALLIAAIGLYGLIRYSVATRMNEIGVRLAVGAGDRQILRMLMLDGLKLSLAGLVFGLAGALWLTRAAENFLYGVAPSDPPTFVAVSVLLTAVAMTACYLSARRANRLDPVAALRGD